MRRFAPDARWLSVGRPFHPLDGNADPTPMMDRPRPMRVLVDLLCPPLHPTFSQCDPWLGRSHAVVDDALGGWGSPANAFGAEVRAAYIDALRDRARVHAICEEYRAATTLDHEHDLADRRAGRRIACPVLVLWSGRGPLGSWYAEIGGPLALWRAWANYVRGGALDAGHFFPEEMPKRTAERAERVLRCDILKESCATTFRRSTRGRAMPGPTVWRPRCWRSRMKPRTTRCW